MANGIECFALFSFFSFRISLYVHFFACVAYFLFRLFVFIYRFFVCIFRYAILDSYSLSVFDNNFFFFPFTFLYFYCFLLLLLLCVFLLSFGFGLVSLATCIGKTHYVRFLLSPIDSIILYIIWNGQFVCHLWQYHKCEAKLLQILFRGNLYRMFIYVFDFTPTNQRFQPNTFIQF